MVKSTMPNLRARVQKSGTTFYYFDAGGKPRKEIPLGSDYVLAVKKWTELMARPESAAPVAHFIALIEKYEKEALPNLAKSTQDTYKSDLKHLREFFGKPTPAPLDEITPNHINRLLKWKKAQPTTANRLKRLFSVLFNYARSEGYTLKANPAVGIVGLPLKDKRNVYISDAVFKAVRDCASEPMRDAMDLGYLTSQRPSDARKLTERDIQDGAIVVRQGKTGNRLRVRVEGELADLIERIKKRKALYKVWSAHLIVNEHGMAMSKQVMRKHFEKARAKAVLDNPDMAAAITDFWFVDLRKKASSDVQESRDLQQASDLLGHANLKTTKENYSPRGKLVKPTK